LIDGDKEWDTQEMVPVPVAEEQEDTDRRGIFHQVFAQETEAGAAIHNKASSGIQQDFHARGVASELQGMGAGGGN